MLRETFALRDGPERLPSAYLGELRSRGWTVLDHVMNKAMLRNLHANLAEVRARPEHAEAEAKQKLEQDLRQ